MPRSTTYRGPNGESRRLAPTGSRASVEALRPFLDATAAAMNVVLLLVDEAACLRHWSEPPSPGLRLTIGPEALPFEEWLAAQGASLDYSALATWFDQALRGAATSPLEWQYAGRIWQATAAPVNCAEGAGASRWLIITLRDISAKREADSLLALYMEALDAAAAGIILCDASQTDMPIVHASKAFLELTGYPLEEVLGRNSRFLQGPGTNPETIGQIHAALAAAEPIDVDILNYRKDGTPFWNHLRIRPLAAQHGLPRLFLGTQEDVTVMRTRLLTAQRRAQFDALTGLPNRLQFEAQMQRLTTEPATEPFTLWLLFLDLDGFKAVNDAAGHASGDTLLIQVAERLSQVARANDLLARLGGDEFVLLLAGSPPVEVVRRVVQNILTALREPFIVDAHHFQLAVSIGIAAWPHDAADGTNLVNAADRAMYQAKSRGRDQAAFFDPALDALR